MSRYIVLWRVKLGSRHVPTGKTRHFAGGALLPPPAELEIVRFPRDPGYYLLYLDENGDEMTDTYHDTVQKAIDQAKWEFRVEEDEWQRAHKRRDARSTDANQSE